MKVNSFFCSSVIFAWHNQNRKDATLRFFSTENIHGLQISSDRRSKRDHGTRVFQAGRLGSIFSNRLKEYRVRDDNIKTMFIFHRGDLLVLTNYTDEPIRSGDIVVINIDSISMPIAHRVIEVRNGDDAPLSFHDV